MAKKRRKTSGNPAVTRAWDRLHRWFERNLPAVLESLHDGVEADEIEEFERTTRRRLPDDVRASLAIHNGQSDLREADGCIYGLLLLPLSQIRRAWELERRLEDDGAASRNIQVYPKDAIQRCQTNPGWIGLTDDWSGNHIGVDTAPDLNGCWGQIIIFGQSEYKLFVVAESWCQFLVDYARQLDSGNFVLERRQDSSGVSFRIKSPDVRHFHQAVGRRYLKRV